MTQPKYAKGDTMKLTGAIDGDGKPFELEVKILSVSSPEPNPTYDVYGKHLTIEEAKALAAKILARVEHWERFKRNAYWFVKRNWRVGL